MCWRLGLSQDCWEDLDFFWRWLPAFLTRACPSAGAALWALELQCSPSSLSVSDADPKEWRRWGITYLGFTSKRNWGVVAWVFPPCSEIQIQTADRFPLVRVQTFAKHVPELNVRNDLGIKNLLGQLMGLSLRSSFSETIRCSLIEGRNKNMQIFSMIFLLVNSLIVLKTVLHHRVAWLQAHGPSASPSECRDCKHEWPCPVCMVF